LPLLRRNKAYRPVFSTALNDFDLDRFVADDPELGFARSVEFEDNVFTAFATGKGQILVL
jgi:hypothetical protein